ncbi:inositol monophosphatase [Geminicoccaceae bacterium 1502E]|nr:inositol monophosphatase [Geminicoccaceae bacterium 1502E]
MTDRDLALRLAAASDVIRAAGRRAAALSGDREKLGVENKGLQDLVSVADKKAEALIRERLGALFPGDGFLGEEEGGEISERMWVIDPIDGTANFVRGIPYWCSVIAYVVEGRTELALTYDAVHDQLFTARRGHGAFRDGRPIRASAVAGGEEACIGLSYTYKTPPAIYGELVSNLLAEKVDHRRLGSSALTLCHVADGRLDGLVCPSCSSWDVIAGLLTVEEAGGRATDYTDGATLLDRRAVAAAAPGIAPLVERASGIAMARR